MNFFDDREVFEDEANNFVSDSLSDLIDKNWVEYDDVTQTSRVKNLLFQYDKNSGFFLDANPEISFVLTHENTQLAPWEISFQEYIRQMHVGFTVSEISDAIGVFHQHEFEEKNEQKIILQTLLFRMETKSYQGEEGKKIILQIEKMIDIINTFGEVSTPRKIQRKSAQQSLFAYTPRKGKIVTETEWEAKKTPEKKSPLVFFNTFVKKSKMILPLFALFALLGIVGNLNPSTVKGDITETNYVLHNSAAENSLSVIQKCVAEKTEDFVAKKYSESIDLQEYVLECFGK